MILHIDDSAEIRELIHRVLSSYGYHVVHAEDGLNGLNLVSQLKPDLVLLDLQMPGMSGFDVVKQIKANPELGQIPVIAFTGSVVPDDHAQLLAVGFDDFLAKPPSISDLLKIVRFHDPGGLS
ncbi:MAG: response regulator [Anaerolineae bacterium]|nr:response regulator [Anaerolineales bacterium]MCQ3977793.1 response regulator [Anaerolineae bacterium]